jgi:hypothetical protein
MAGTWKHLLVHGMCCKITQNFNRLAMMTKAEVLPIAPTKFSVLFGKQVPTTVEQKLRSNFCNANLAVFDNGRQYRICDTV